MLKAFEDLVVGDFAGLQQNEIAALIERSKRRQPAMREVFERTAQIAADIRKETNNFNK